MSESSSDDENGFNALFSIRNAHSEAFYFNKITILDCIVTFEFQFCDDEVFESQLHLDKPANAVDAPCLFAIGMCVCSWFWMGYNTKQIVIREEVCCMCNLNSKILPFWGEIYRNIALEFAFVNKTELNMVDIILESVQDQQLSCTSSITRGCYSTLIPIGGGKDSLVVWDQHNQQQKICGNVTGKKPEKPLLLYVADGLEEYSDSWRLQKLVDMTGDDIFLVRHEFQNQLLHRRKRSYFKPCAHPWAALVLFDSVLIAQLEGAVNVKLGYERSADEGNGVFIQGLEVNHQFDKSSVFLALAQEYINTFINPEIQVVSTLHKLWEIQIAKMFCESTDLKRFLPVFLSCNDPTDQCDWCKRCEKCAFIFLLLCAWLPPDEVISSVFGGENMLLLPECRKDFKALVGLAGPKPLDCVGTVAEATAAVHLTAMRFSTQATDSNTDHNNSDVYCPHATEMNDSTADNLPVELIAQQLLASTDTLETFQMKEHLKRCACMPPLLKELCIELGIQWCDKCVGPMLRNPQDILSHWSCG